MACVQTSGPSPKAREFVRDARPEPAGQAKSGTQATQGTEINGPVALEQMLSPGRRGNRARPGLYHGPP